MPVFLLTEKIEFPPPHLAREDGLLAIGGDLSQNRLLLAYRMGIFPWFSDDEAIMWWCPDPRLVLYPDELRIPKSLRKVLNKNLFQITVDTAFKEVITECAQVRTEAGEGTWIVEEMIAAYCKLHESGFAHSIEAWYHHKLAGGLYGISMGGCFFGESMFTRVNNASKVTLVFLSEYLKSLSFDIIDCQVTTEHMMRFGARTIPRDFFLNQLQQSITAPDLKGKWVSM